MFGGKVSCGGCQQKVKLTRDPTDRRSRVKVCPRCLTPQGAAAPLPVAQGGPAQHILVYDAAGTRGRPRDTFTREAAALARVGWRVGNQSTAGTVRVVAHYEPRTITVTYVRD